MQNPHYALVAYVRHPVGDFVENVRKELHPELPLTPAHFCDTLQGRDFVHFLGLAVAV